MPCLSLSTFPRSSVTTWRNGCHPAKWCPEDHLSRPKAHRVSLGWWQEKRTRKITDKKCKLTTRRTCYKNCTRWTRETRVRVDAWKNYDFAPSFSILLTFRAKHWFQEAEPCKKRPFFRADYTVRTFSQILRFRIYRDACYYRGLVIIIHCTSGENIETSNWINRNTDILEQPPTSVILKGKLHESEKNEGYP